MSVQPLPKALTARLEEGERILWSASPAKGSVPRPVFILLPAIAAAAALPLLTDGPVDRGQVGVIGVMLLVAAVFVGGNRRSRRGSVFAVTDRRAIAYVDKASPNFAWLEFRPDTIVQLGAFGRVEFAAPGKQMRNTAFSGKQVFAGPTTKNPELFSPHGRQQRLLFHGVNLSAERLGPIRQTIRNYAAGETA